MKNPLHEHSQRDLRDLFIQKAKSFINGLSDGRTLDELNDLRDDIRELSKLIKTRETIRKNPGRKTAGSGTVFVQWPR